VGDVPLGQLTERKIRHLDDPKSPRCRMHFEGFGCML
jgi:hypothetical protein